MAVVAARLGAGTAVEMQARQFSWRGDELPPRAGRTPGRHRMSSSSEDWRPVSRSPYGCTRTTSA